MKLPQLLFKIRKHYDRTHEDENCIVTLQFLETGSSTNIQQLVNEQFTTREETNIEADDHTNPIIDSRANITAKLMTLSSFIFMNMS